MTSSPECPEALAHALAGLLGSDPQRTLRQLAAETGLQNETLTELTTPGSQPLSWEVTCAYVKARGGDRDHFRTLWRRAVNAMETPPWQSRDATGRVIGLWKQHDPSGPLPDPCQARTEAELIRQLDKLRKWAGVSLRELESRTLISDSTLSELLNNHRKLSPDRADILAAACGLPPLEAKRWVKAAEQAMEASARALPATAERPEPAARTLRQGRSGVVWPRRPARSGVRSRWLLAPAAMFIAGVVCGWALIGAVGGDRADYVYLQYAKPVVVVPGAAATFPVGPLPSRGQDWYLDLRLRLGYTNPLADCISLTRVTYRIAVDGRKLRRGTSGLGEADIAVRNVHLGPASIISITVTLRSPDGCALKLNPTGTIAHPAN